MCPEGSSMDDRFITQVEHLDVSTFVIPTDGHESDGTLEWNATTIVVVELRAGGRSGLGYTYADRATANVVADTLSPCVVGTDAMSVAGTWERMVRGVRNLGRPGIAAM